MVNGQDGPRAYIRAMANSLQNVEQEIADAESVGESAAKRDAEALIAFETELAAASVPVREAGKNIAARRRALRQEFKRSSARSRWYDEYDYDNDRDQVWNSAGTEQRVQHLQALLVGSTRHS